MFTNDPVPFLRGVVSDGLLQHDQGGIKLGLQNAFVNLNDHDERL